MINDNVFREIRSELNRIVETSTSSVSPSQKKSAEFIIDKFKCISDNLHEITQLKSDALRNFKINELTKGGAEAGFSSSSQVLSQRITIFLQTYALAKEKKDLPNFFKCFAQGDPCLSGKMESLNKYAALLSMGIDVDSLVDPEKKLDLPSYIFSECLYDLKEKETTKEELIDYILANLKAVAGEFRAQEETRGGEAFLFFLKEINIYKNGDPKDWEKLITEFATSGAFTAVHRKACELVI